MSTFLENQKKLEQAKFKQNEIEHVEYLSNLIHKHYKKIENDDINPDDLKKLLSMLAESNTKLRDKLENEFNEIWK